MRRQLQSPVLVTGAAGYIGSHMVSYLAKEGYDIIVSGRERSRLEASFGGMPHVATAVADMAKQESLGALLEKRPRTIINCAGKVGIDGPRKAEEYHEINRTGLENLLTACRELDGVRFIHLSTIAVYCKREGNLGLVADEETPLAQDTGIPYIDSKVEGELLLQNHMRQHGDRVRITTIRPGAVYGRAMPRILGLARSPLGLPRLGDGNSPSSLIHIDNLVRAMRCAAESDAAVGQAYNAVDDGLYGTSIAMSEYLDTLMRRYGISPAGIASMPLPAVRYIAACCERAQDPADKMPPAMSPMMVIMLGDSPHIDGRKLMRLQDGEGKPYSEQPGLIRSLDEGIATLPKA